MVKPTLIELPCITSKKCILSIIEASKQCNFQIKRQYFLKTSSEKAARGRHSHKNLKQLLVCLLGEAVIKIEGPEGNYRFELNSAKKALFIPPAYWREIKLYPNTILSVLASEEYKEDDYIRNYEDFKLELKNKNN